MKYEHILKKNNGVQKAVYDFIILPQVIYFGILMQIYHISKKTYKNTNNIRATFCLTGSMNSCKN